MSRWAEMFAALSHPADTIDTRDTTPAHQRPTRNCVRSVNCVKATEEKAEARARVDSEQPVVVTAGDLDEHVVLIEEGAGVSRSWAEGFAALCVMPPPTGFSSERWRRVIDAASVFFDRWADVAAACGWTDLDVFGCNPHRPDARFDCMGLVLLLDRCEVVGIDEHGADLVTNTGAAQRFRRRPLPLGTIRLWQLQR
jgi:hypothetical protein